MTLGAVKSPDVEIDPALVVQLTAVFVEPLTFAVNCWVPPEETVALVGEIEIATTAGASTVILAEAELDVSAWLVALTVTVVFEVTVGAVNSPEVEIDPALADQVTAVLVEPLTVAVNCWVPPEVTVALLGETETDTTPAGVTVTAAEADFVVSA